MGKGKGGPSLDPVRRGKGISNPYKGIAQESMERGAANLKRKGDSKGESGKGTSGSSHEGKGVPAPKKTPWSSSSNLNLSNNVKRAIEMRRRQKQIEMK